MVIRIFSNQPLIIFLLDHILLFTFRIQILYSTLQFLQFHLIDGRNKKTFSNFIRDATFNHFYRVGDEKKKIWDPFLSLSQKTISRYITKDFLINSEEW